MTTAIVALAILAGILGVIAAFSLRSALSSGRAIVAEQKAHIVTRGERDTSIAQNTVLADQLSRERTLRIAAEQQRNDAKSKEREHVHAEILASTMDDAVRIAADRMSPAMPAVSDAPAGDGDRGAGAVQPAGPAIVDPILTLK